jgi:hypothetical protein
MSEPITLDPRRYAGWRTPAPEGASATGEAREAPKRLLGEAQALAKVQHGRPE